MRRDGGEGGNKRKVKRGGGGGGGAEGRGEAERGAGNGLKEAQGNWGAEGGCGVEGEHGHDGESAAGCGVAEIRRAGNGFREARRPLREPRWGVPPTLWPHAGGD